MNPLVAWSLVACALALALVLATLGWARGRRLSAELRAARADADALAERVASLEAARAGQVADLTGAPRRPGHVVDEQTYVITHVGDEVEPAGAGARVEPPLVEPRRVDGREFADIVARETVVKAAGLAHGVRRAMSPATRNRIRFEMRREVKRSRRSRRAEMKQAWREYRARQRGLVEDGGVA